MKKKLQQLVIRWMIVSLTRSASTRSYILLISAASFYFHLLPFGPGVEVAEESSSFMSLSLWCWLSYLPELPGSASLSIACSSSASSRSSVSRLLAVLLPHRVWSCRGLVFNFSLILLFSPFADTSFYCL